MSQEINLLGPQLRRRRGGASSAAVLGPALLAATAIGVGVALFLRHQGGELREQHARNEGAIAQAQEEQRKLSQEVAQLKKDPALDAELSALEKRLVGLQLDLAALSNGAIGDTRGFADFMRALAQQSMDGVWLTGFSVGAAGRDVSISGRALRAELVPVYLRRLGQDPYFAGRTFAALDLTQPRVEPGAGAAAGGAVAFSLMSRPERGPSAGDGPGAGVRAR